jgi:site-specific recombinase XerD
MMKNNVEAISASASRRIDLSIHDFQGKLERLLGLLDERAGAHNAELLRSFHQYQTLAVRASLAHRLGYLHSLVRFAQLVQRLAGKNLDDVTILDLKKVVMSYEANPRLSGNHKAGVKRAIRAFYKWRSWGDDATRRRDAPKIVSWMSLRIPLSERRQIRPEDILTYEEVLQIIKHAGSVRNRALLSVLYETGARIGELGNRRIGDVTPQEEGFRIHLAGKTGERDRILLFSAAHLAAWLNQHPMAGDPNAPLWVGPTLKRLKYSGVRMLLDRLRIRTGMTKRLHAHLFRHSRVTHVLATGLMNEAQAKHYFGWTAASPMLGRYLHLVSKDVDQAYKRMLGLPSEPGDEMPNALRVHLCRNCKAANPSTQTTCWRCSKNLKPDTVQTPPSTRVEDLLHDPEVQAFLARKLREVGLGKSN